MPRPRTSLKSFLHSAKSFLTSPEARSQATPPLTFVIGNESADLDSICTSIVLAYLKTYSPSPSPNYPSQFYIPLANIPRSEVRLRPELQPVLSCANLETEDLITLSDLPFPVTGKDSEEKNELGENSKWFLVDHNVLTGDIGHQFSDKVVGVIDHHVDEHKHSLTTSPTEGEGRAIRPVGSCMTLAIQTLRDTWPERHDKWDEELAYLALGPILVDTDNCTNKDKTTQEDIDAEEFLEALATDFLRDSYVGEIKKKKKDIGDLTVEEILRKDFKQWTEGDIVLGVSSVVRSIAWLVKKAGGEDEFVGLVEKFGKERAIGQGKKGLGLCCVMASSSDKGGRFRREIFLLARTAEAKKAGEKFEKEAQENLGLKGWDEGNLDLDTGGEEDGNGGWRKCFVQEKTENSRKQVAPLLREAMV